jgi:hypothetical protein
LPANRDDLRVDWRSRRHFRCEHWGKRLGSNPAFFYFQLSVRSLSDSFRINKGKNARCPQSVVDGVTEPVVFKSKLAVPTAL